MLPQPSQLRDIKHQIAERLPEPVFAHVTIACQLFDRVRWVTSRSATRSHIWEKSGWGWVKVQSPALLLAWTTTCSIQPGAGERWIATTRCRWISG